MHLLGKLLVLNGGQGRLALHLKVLPDLLLFEQPLPVLWPQCLRVSLLELIQLFDVFWLNGLFALQIRI